MKINYVDGREKEGLFIGKCVIRINGNLKNHWVVGIYSPFQLKDEIKEFVRYFKGSWQDLQGFWYAPFDSTKKLNHILNSIKSADWVEGILTGGQLTIYCPDQVKETVEEVFSEGVSRIFTIQPHDEKNYNIHQDFVLADRTEVEQKQSHVSVGDVLQRVVLFENKPSDFESVQNEESWLSGGEYRQFTIEATEYWACPWKNPLDKNDFGGWKDASYTEPVVSFHLKMKNGVPQKIFAQIEDKKNFYDWLRFIKSIPGRKWNQKDSTWDFSIEYWDDVASEIIAYTIHFNSREKSFTANWQKAVKANFMSSDDRLEVSTQLKMFIENQIAANQEVK